MAENDSEGIAIALLTSHNNTHVQSTVNNSRQAHSKAPQIARPELKQDVSAEEWYSFKEEWKRFKRIINIPQGELADQLFQCCDRPLGRLLLKENPDVIDAGEDVLMEAMKKMAVLQVATSVRRTKLLVTKQEHGQLFREFYANVRAAASTCEFVIKCPHQCCVARGNIDYTSSVVKDIIVAGIADAEIRKDVLGHPDLDTKSDKDIVRLVEEKEIARNACNVTRSDVAGMSSYRRQAKDDIDGNPAINKKLIMKGKCCKCNEEINLYTRYRSGKLNKEPFKTCVKCFKNDKFKQPDKRVLSNKNSENGAIVSFIETIAAYDRDRSDSNISSPW